MVLDLFGLLGDVSVCLRYSAHAGTCGDERGGLPRNLPVGNLGYRLWLLWNGAWRPTVGIYPGMVEQLGHVLLRCCHVAVGGS